MSDERTTAILGRAASPMAASLSGDAAGLSGPRFDGGPVPGGSAADRPLGLGQHATVPPHVGGLALDAEPVGDLGQPNRLTVVHAENCSEPLDNRQGCSDTHYMSTLRYQDSKVVVAPIEHYVGPRHVRTTWFAGLAHNEPGAEIEVRCPHTVKGHSTTAAAIKCGQAMARRLPGATS
jgi:hypothetical protein